MSSDIPEELQEQALTGRMLLVISCDEYMNLEVEESTFPGWALAGVADWLTLAAERAMSEEIAEANGVEEEEEEG